MDIEQASAGAGFALWGKSATYDAGAAPVDCTVVVDVVVDHFADDRLGIARMELTMLVSEVGAYKPGASLSILGEVYTVRNLVDDDGVVRRVVAEAV